MTTVNLKLKPFMVPNYVSVESSPKSREEGFQESRKFHLSELDDATLQGLLDQFCADVYKKAGK